MMWLFIHQPYWSALNQARLVRVPCCHGESAQGILLGEVSPIDPKSREIRHQASLHNGQFGQQICFSFLPHAAHQSSHSSNELNIQCHFPYIGLRIMSEFPLLRPNAYAGTPGSGRQGAAVAEALPPTPTSRPEALSCVATREDYWGKALRRLDATKQNCIRQALEKQQDGSGGSVDVDDAKESRLRLQDGPVITEGSLSWPDILSEVCRRSQRLEDDRTKKRNFRFAGRDVNLRKTLETWVKFFNRIKQIGDIAVNVDPIHAGLPWAAIRLIITVCEPKQDLRRFNSLMLMIK